MRRIIALLVFACIALSPEVTLAQGGSFLESLFRSIAEKKMDDVRQRGTAPEPPRGNRIPTDPQRQTTPGGFPSGPLGPARGPTRPPTKPSPRATPFPADSRRDEAELNSRNQRPRTIRTNSPEVRDFAQHLVGFDRELETLMQTVQTQARSNRSLRVLLPQLFQIQADSRALLARCDGASSIAPLLTPYRSIDQRYREVSFQLRSLPERDAILQQGIRGCDQSCRTLTRHCGIKPQFDRHGLHDQMVIAATYIQALLDDLPTTRMPSDQSREFIHQGRILRQAILEEADQVEEVTYEEIVSRFTEFVTRWYAYSDSIAATNDPILLRRLSRISQCGDKSYAILWMPPPARSGRDISGPGFPNPGVDGRPSVISRPFEDPGAFAGGRQIGREDLISQAASLEGSMQYFTANLSRYERYITPTSFRASLFQNTEAVQQLSSRLYRELDQWEPLPRLQRTASELAQAWQKLSSDIEHLDHHGLSGRRAASVTQQHQSLAPIMATLTATLLPLN